MFLILIWGVLFIAYASVFGTRLQTWDDEVPAHCYKTTATALPNASHPLVDRIYIGITCLYIAGTFGFASQLALQSAQQHMASELPETLQILLNTSRRILSELATSSVNTPATDLQYAVLAIAMMQCPLHIYSIFALRASNERFLGNGGSEQEWGFGQITAVILLGNNVLQFVDGIASMCLFRLPK